MGEYKHHFAFHQTCADISRTILKRQKEEWGDEEDVQEYNDKVECNDSAN